MSSVRTKRTKNESSGSVRYTSDFGLAVRGLLSAKEAEMTAKRQKTVVVAD
tara:strand:+ start:504 stop:656 length:153 start_codon:yes stop_codon:yes gene_type:complete